MNELVLVRLGGLLIISSNYSAVQIQALSLQYVGLTSSVSIKFVTISPQLLQREGPSSQLRRPVYFPRLLRSVRYHTSQ